MCEITYNIPKFLRPKKKKKLLHEARFLAKDTNKKTATEVIV